MSVDVRSITDADFLCQSGLRLLLCNAAIAVLRQALRRAHVALGQTSEGGAAGARNRAAARRIGQPQQAPTPDALNMPTSEGQIWALSTSIEAKSNACTFFSLRDFQNPTG